MLPVVGPSVLHSVLLSEAVIRIIFILSCQVWGANCGKGKPTLGTLVAGSYNYAPLNTYLCFRLFKLFFVIRPILGRKISDFFKISRLNQNGTNARKILVTSPFLMLMGSIHLGHMPGTHPTDIWCVFKKCAVIFVQAVCGGQMPMAPPLWLKPLNSALLQKN